VFRAAKSISLVLIGLFFCSGLFVLPNATADQTLLNDNFTADNGLNPSLWQSNGPTGTAIFSGIKQAVDSGYGNDYFSLIDPSPTFSSQGMQISSVNQPFRMTTIESVNSFSAPLTLQASVFATQSGGCAFCLWIANDKDFYGIDCALNPSATYYGIWSCNSARDTNQMWSKLISSYPATNVIYQLTISVNSASSITLSVSSNGQTLGSQTELSTGSAPFKIVLSQIEVYTGTGTGPNQAFWKSVTLSSSSPSTTPSSTPATSTSPTSSPNNGVSPAPTIENTVTNSPTPAKSANPDQTTLTSSTPNVSETPKIANQTLSPFLADLFLSPIALPVLILAIISVNAIAAFAVIKARKNKKKPNAISDSKFGAQNAGEQPMLKRWFLPALLVAGISAGITDLVLVNFATDIAKTFFGNAGPTSIGAVSQLSTVNAAGVFLFTIISSFLIIRLKHKQMYLAGLFLIIASSIGDFLAPSLVWLQVFFVVEGVGSVIISITSATLIGNSFPPEKKARALSFLLAIGASTTLIMIPTLGYINSLTGWRFCFAFLVLPAALAGLILCAYAIPPTANVKNFVQKENPYKESMKLILKNKSALACLIASLLTVAGGQVAVFAMAFYRTRFGAPRELTLGFYEVAILLALIGYLSSGLLINKFGAKKIAIFSTAVNCLMTATFFFIPNLWIAFSLDMTHVWFASLATLAFAYLGLEQVPKYRGTMVSLGNLFNTIGNMIAPALGGVLLTYATGLRYGAVGIALSMMTLTACGVALVWIKDMGYQKPKLKNDLSI
jgi:MFS transporter, DHA1 family, multidrug resistance protein